MTIDVTRGARLLRWAGLAMAATTLSGCAAFYVDTGLADMKPEEIKKPVAAKPVQFLFSFQSKGTANAQATGLLKTQVTEQVQASGLFSQLSEAPVDGGGVLSITINNVPITEDAAAKGFATGLTMGLAGSTVTDGYIGTFDYLPPAPAAKLSFTVRHAIHATIGNSDAPPHAVKAASIEEAVRTMARQLVGNGLKDLSRDPGFGK